ncbi:MAG: ABC transporter ATP-binding protein [Firmicutes bacterium]|jgi:ABC-2 type transport system ATP-binding protein|nr:ABC transporter ATP-binding protein [Bacillota bacterium]
MNRNAGEEPVIRTRALAKTYGGLKAVDCLDLDIHEGEIFGLLGPNGAGKTTTILMLLGLTEPTSGSVKVCGFDPVRQPLEVKKIVGYLPDRVSFYDDMTAEENLLFTAALNDIPRERAAERASRLLERVGLGDSGGRKVREFSRGMVQRLGIADALMKDPRVVILDEPTLGIDPTGVRETLDLIVGLSRRDNITVLLSTHLLYQVQEICDRIAVFYRGKAVAVGRIDDLCADMIGAGPCTIEVEASGAGVESAIQGLPWVRSCRTEGSLKILECDGDRREEISRAIFEAGGVPKHLRLAGFGLDELYRRYFQDDSGGGDA